MHLISWCAARLASTSGMTLQYLSKPSSSPMPYLPCTVEEVIHQSFTQPCEWPFLYLQRIAKKKIHQENACKFNTNYDLLQYIFDTTKSQLMLQIWITAQQ